MAPMRQTTGRVITSLEQAHEQLSDALRTAMLALTDIEEGHRTPAAHARLAIDTVEKILIPTAAEIEGVTARAAVDARQSKRSHTPDAASLVPKGHEGDPCPNCRSTDTEGEGTDLVCHNCGLMPYFHED